MKDKRQSSKSNFPKPPDIHALTHHASLMGHLFDKVQGELRRMVEGAVEPIDSSERVSPLVIIGKKVFK